MDTKNSKKTLVIGASENPSRYSFRAINRLVDSGHEVVAIGRKAGKVGAVEIITGTPDIPEIDTITLYVNPSVQAAVYEDYILSLNPKRIIFNPGTEHPTLIQRAKEKGIHTEIACTLVMLSVDDY